MKKSFPLSILLSIWLLQRSSTPSVAALSRRLHLLDDLYYSLQIPSTKVERWILIQVLGWIERERQKIQNAALENLSIKLGQA